MPHLYDPRNPRLGGNSFLALLGKDAGKRKTAFKEIAFVPLSIAHNLLRNVIRRQASKNLLNSQQEFNGQTA
jgi:hypothetical protein